MATLPETTINLSQGVAFQDWPTKTWYVNPSTKQVSGMADGQLAMRQAVEILFSTERFDWQIYTPNFGMQWRGLIGQSPGYVGLEIQRRIQDAIKPDRRMTGIENFSYTVKGDSMTVSFTVTTVYGPVPQTIRVTS